MSYKNELYREALNGKISAKQCDEIMKKQKPLSRPSSKPRSSLPVHNKKRVTDQEKEEEFDPSDIFTEHSETFNKLSSNTIDVNQKISSLESQIVQLEKIIHDTRSEIDSIKKTQSNTLEMLNLLSKDLASAKSKIIR